MKMHWVKKPSRYELLINHRIFFTFSMLISMCYFFHVNFNVLFISLFFISSQIYSETCLTEPELFTCNRQVSGFDRLNVQRFQIKFIVQIIQKFDLNQGSVLDRFHCSRTDNTTTVERKRTIGKKLIHKTLHTKLKIEQHKLNKKCTI